MGKNTYKILRIALLCFLIAGSLVIGIIIGINKEIHYCDEVWSYESANSTWKESVYSRSYEWLSGKDISDYLSATEKEMHFGDILNVY